MIDFSLTHVMSFDYDDKPRYVEVHAIGTTSKGQVLRGWQIAGESSRPLPCWALFSLDKMSNILVTDILSQAPRPGYAMNDKQMIEILAQVELP